jgi:hypothetical protein
LDRNWVKIRLHKFSNIWGTTTLSISLTEPGMSGSPILNEAGQAVGVIAISTETTDSKGERKQEEEQGPQPIPIDDLPGWLLKYTQRRHRRNPRHLHSH